MTQLQFSDNLTVYQVDPQVGFLPNPAPLKRLPADYDSWETTLSHLPTLLVTSQLHRTIEQLPCFEVSPLTTPPQLERAMLLLSMLASAYVWGRPQPTTTIPSNLARPLWAVAEILHRPPILGYTSCVLYNWQPLIHDAPLTLENIAIQHIFTGGTDEQWFYMVSAAIEAAGTPALRAIVTAQQAIAEGNVEAVASHLQTIAATVTDMTAILLRLPEQCAPYIFYHRLRPFLAGWSEPGVIYDGVASTPYQFLGSSAAQSPLLQAIDAGLGVQHQTAQTAYLRQIRPYLLQGHRQFIETLENGSTIRQFVTGHPQLREPYNACLKALDNFRKKHLELVVRYISHQAPEDQTGTGGTDFVTFLSQVRQETKHHFITEQKYY